MKATDSGVPSFRVVSLTSLVEYGHYHDGNANAVAGKLIGSSFHYWQ